MWYRDMNGTNSIRKIAFELEEIMDIVKDENERHFAKKHPPGNKVNPNIEAALKQDATGGELPCAVAFNIARDLHVSPKEVGRVADLLEMRLAKCQLGLFGYHPEKRIVKPAEHVSGDLEKAIRAKIENGKLPCESAWGIAKNLTVPKMAISSACQALGIKISSCQLGAF